MKFQLICLSLVSLLFFAPTTSAANSDIDEALSLIRNDKSEQALPILFPLADKGNAEAMIALGYYYLLEKEDQPTGLNWFRKGVLSDNDEAQLHLGMVLTEILDGDENFTEGVDWLKKSAFQGNKIAAEQLAAYYYTGKGTIKKNLTLSNWWSNRAKNN